MTEAEAHDWLVERFGVSRETYARLKSFVAALIEENSRQNLISASTVSHIWARHIVDSAQLLTLQSTKPNSLWLDLGTGAGFPGIVIAILSERPVLLVESRRKRFQFLAEQAEALGLANVHVHGGRLETLETKIAGVISARAFAPLPKLMTLAHRFSQKDTVWLLPKGQSVREELESVRGSWQGAFHVKPSLTDADAAIIVATGVSPRKNAG